MNAPYMNTPAPMNLRNQFHAFSALVSFSATHHSRSTRVPAAAGDTGYFRYAPALGTRSTDSLSFVVTGNPRRPTWGIAMRGSTLVGGRVTTEVADVEIELFLGERRDLTEGRDQLLGVRMVVADDGLTGMRAGVEPLLQLAHFVLA